MDGDESMCQRCGLTMVTRDGDDPTIYCDHCAQDIVAEVVPALLAANRRLRHAANCLVAAANVAWAHLDADRDMKCLKLLKAMAGECPGYTIGMDATHAALAEPEPTVG